MFLTPYFSSNNHQFQFTRQQASHFAKKIAGDFNPIHDEDNKRFCVPGDLLFAVLLKKEGISQRMSFNFSGMVNDGTALHIENKDEVESAVVVDENGKEYLHMTREGQVSHDTAFIEHLVTSYVRFSGMNFPHILLPLLEEKQVMISCERPLVIYESMQIEFEHLNLTHPEIEFQNATLNVEGKRGFITLNFSFKDAGQVVGQGIKRMVASGLKDYNQGSVDELVQRFNDRKAFFMAQFATEAA